MVSIRSATYTSQYTRTLRVATYTKVRWQGNNYPPGMGLYYLLYELYTGCR